MTTQWAERAPRFAALATAEVLGPGVTPQRVLQIDNISVTGVFARTSWPLPKGTPFKVCVLLDDQCVEAEVSVARVELRDPLGPRQPKGGMGLQFEGLGAEARRSLVNMVIGLAERTRLGDGLSRDSAWPRQYRWQSRVPGASACTTFMTAQSACVVASEREQLRQAWEQSLAKGEIFIVTPLPAPPGTRLKVSLSAPHGAMELAGKVVDVVDRTQAELTGHPPGMSLKLTGLRGRRRRELEGYVTGRSPALGKIDASAQAVALAVGAFLRTLQNEGEDAALGLPADASQKQRQERITELKQMFAVRGSEMSPVVRHQLDQALWTLQSLEDQTYLQ